MTEQTDAAEVEALADLIFAETATAMGDAFSCAEAILDSDLLAAREAAAEARGAQAVLDDLERRIRHQAKAAAVGSMEWRAHFADLAHLETARARATAAGGACCAHPKCPGGSLCCCQEADR